MWRIGGRKLVVGLVVAGSLGTLAARDVVSSASGRHSRPGLSAVQHVMVDGMRMGYRIGGRGPALVMIIGRSATMAEWDPKLIGQLITGHQVIVFDNRGVATSDNPSRATLTIARMAKDTLGLMTQLHLRRADVLGWSMGGMIAQQVALDAPGRVIKLVLCATTPGGSQARQPSGPVNKILDRSDLSTATLFALSFPPDRAGVTGAVRYGLDVAAQPDLLPGSFTISPATRANQEQATAQWKAPGGGDYQKLPSLRLPVLVLWGRLDEVEPPYNDQLIVSRIPGARGRSFGNAGYAFLFQRPVAVGRTIDQFLR
jgi:pimeloyl-ACP methyl ester carboxylesterase